MTSIPGEAAERALEWSPLPPCPPELAELVARAAGLLDEYVSGRDDRLEAFAAAMDAILRHRELRRAPTPFRAAVMNRAGIAHSWLCTWRRSFVEGTTALRVLDEAAAVVAPGSAEAARIQNNVAMTRLNLFAQRSRQSDLDEAISAARKAVQIAPDIPTRCLGLSALSNALRYRYRMTGRHEDIDSAVEYGREAVERSPEGPRRVAYRSGLADVLQTRYVSNGSLVDLDGAITLLETCMQAPHLPVQVQLGHIKGTLGQTLRNRYLRTRSAADIDRAVQLLADAVDLRSSDPARLTNLGNALLTRYEDFGDLEDLQAAVYLQEAAVRTTRKGDWQLASRHNNAGNALSRMADERESRKLRRQAVDHYRSALRLTDPRAPERSSREYNLGRELETLSAGAISGGLVSEGRAAYLAAIDHGLQGSLEWASAAAMRLGRWATQRGAWTEAAEGYDAALDVARRLFQIQVLRAHKEAWLADVQGLPGEAAIAFVRTGRIEEAMLALESGRSLLLAEALDRDRANLESLAADGWQSLANSYRATAGELAQALNGSADAQRIEDLRRSLDAVTASIRALPGHEGFLAQPTWDDITAAVPERSVLVYLAPSPVGGVAIIVSRGTEQVQVIDLPQCTATAVRRRVDGLFAARTDRDPSSGTFRGTLDAVTRWCWDAVLAPILAATAAPHLVLSASGLLTMLPLHAAWAPASEIDAGRRRYALDERLISYTPTARILAASQQVAAAADAGSLLIVRDPTPSTLPTITMAHVETAWAASRMPASTILTGPRASVDEVSAEMLRCGVHHFACHGSSLPYEPLMSGLSLADDGRLTMRDILDLRLDGAGGSRRGARLSVLSACSTDQPGAELPDEVLSLPSGLLQAGVAGVIAAQWSVHDQASALLMARFYVAWRDERRSPLEALIAAQRWMRTTTNRQKVEDLTSAMRGSSAAHEWVDAQRWLVRLLQLRDPGRYDEAEPAHWAAFSYHGT
jgi:CHAT domain-containing protein